MDYRTSRSINWWRILGWLVTLAALGFIGRWIFSLDHQVWRSLLELKAGWLILAIGLFQIWFLSRFFIWEYIVHRHGSDAARHQTLFNWTISELMRYVPGNVWSFAAKYKSSVDSGSSAGSAIQALIIEAMGLTSGALVVTLLFLWQAKYWWAALLFIVIWPLLWPTFLKLVNKISRRAEDPRLNLNESVTLTAGYALSWVVYGLANVAIFRSFANITFISLPELIGINVGAWFLGYVSIITPMGLGVREVAFVKLLNGAIVANTASLLSIITRLFTIISEMVFLLIVLVWNRIKRK